MENYLVTKFLTKFGYYACAFLVTMFAVAGFFAKGVGGGFGGLFIGALVCIPTMMFCEMCFALIKIEANTRNNSHSNKHHINHAA